MVTEILPVSLENKATVIKGIRDKLIPALIERDYPAEKVLAVLHRAGTIYSKPETLTHEFLRESYIAFYAGINPVPPHKEELDALIAILKYDTNRFTTYCYCLKGGYRILGCFAPNPEIGQFASDANEYFTGALPLRNRDYHYDETPFYHPPVFNLHRLMGRICNDFDYRFGYAKTDQDIAEEVARFYYWGLIMCHPFTGGNHRAFDRFVEYAFATKGIKVRVPLNETLNIPNKSPFNVALYKERRRFLEEAGLAGQEFDMKGWKDMESWLRYQDKLNQALRNHIEENDTRVKKVTQALLSWR